MDQHILTATVDNDDEGDRPTLPALRPTQRPKVRQKTRVGERARFDDATEQFFSNVETLPELTMDADFLAKLAEASSAVEDEASAWWAEQRRSMHVRLVAVLLAASLALLFAGALR